ncbi:MAG: hypothetical protein J6C26_10925 [Clostridia bacterium]|nr:hypothetical protein [Clostridia bacterium]
MNSPPQRSPLGIRTTVYGHTGRGLPLQEYQWGNAEKSVLFLSGLHPADRPVSNLLLRWCSMLEEGCERGGILGDFNLNHLQKRCRIRLIPHLDPNIVKINRNGLSNIKENIESNVKPEEDRINFRGVNLNRNFNANWIKMKKRDPLRIDCGLFPESEAEVACFVRRMKEDPPLGAVILRQGQGVLFYSLQATQKEQKEAFFLGQYGGFSVQEAFDTDGTALQWLTDRGVKTVEVGLSPKQIEQKVKMRDFLTMCAALT